MNQKLYSIHQVAELLGISADAIRLYEKNGLVQPIRNETNGYRCYEAEQIHKIMGIALYRKLDVGIAQIKSLLQLSDLSSIIQTFASFEEENEARIEELKQKTEKLIFMRHHLESIAEGVDCISVRKLPARYILAASPQGKIDYDEMAKIISQPVFSFGNFCYSGCQNREGEFETEELQFVIREPMMELCPAEIEKTNLRRLEECNCLYTVNISPEWQSFQWNLEKLLDYAGKEGIDLTGEVYGFYVYSLVDGEKIDDYYEIYLPVL